MYRTFSETLAFQNKIWYVNKFTYQIYNPEYSTIQNK